LGGTGNIGIDSGDLCIISNNLINNENSTTAVSGFRNGISLNSQLAAASGNTEVNIIGNTIASCVDNGIHVHDDTDGDFGGSDGGFIFSGDIAGNGIIVGNVFGDNGTDVRIENSAGPTSLKANKLQTVNIADIAADKVRFGAGEISFAATLQSNQSQSISLNDLDWKKVNLANNNGRLTSISSNEIVVPCGGLYQLNGKIRLAGISALDADFVTLAIRHTPVGGSTAAVGITNIDLDPNSNIPDIVELLVSATALLSRGTVGLYFKVYGVAGTAVVDASPTETYFNGAVLG
jgi:hypothetical protein